LMTDPRRRRLVGGIGVALNLAALGYFKYANFFIENVDALFGVPLPLSSVILPIGISFFTFQQIAYLVDVMRGAPVERDLVSYTLFVAFFPHLIAGPLVHHAEMIPQFRRGRSVGLPLMIARGIAIFVVGLFKKVVIADSLAQLVSPVFAHADAGGSVTTSWAWLATLAYTLQIYFDFSGYSDMAIGLALLFGIRLPVNFRSPYRAASIIEFWRRWHITLSRFLRDYLYVPLGGNRRGQSRRYVNLMVTMLLGGLWHGAAWTFVIWGGLHGLYLALNHLWRAATDRRIVSTVLTRAAGWLATLLAVVFAWVFFRAGTLAGAWRMVVALVGAAPDGQAYASSGVLTVFGLPVLVGDRGLYLIGLAAVAVAIAIVVAMPNVPRVFRYREYRRAPAQASALRWRPNTVWSIIVAAMLTTALFGMWQRLEFLYFQF